MPTKHSPNYQRLLQCWLKLKSGAVTGQSLAEKDIIELLELRSWAVVQRLPAIVVAIDRALMGADLSTSPDMTIKLGRHALPSSLRKLAH